MKIFCKILIFTFLATKLSVGFAQIDDDLLEDDTLNLKNTYIPELEAAKTEKRELRKVRQKKNTFFGIKTKKSFIKKESGSQTSITMFNFMKTYSEPNSYVKDVYWYNPKKGEIVANPNPKKIDKASWRLLHGPYYRTLNNKLTDTGFFFMGTKHGRWEKYATNGQLLEKTQFHKGWLKHSKITYFDVAATKIKEVIPVHHGRITGDYFLFYENGQIATEGRYDHDTRVGKWVDYYSNKYRKKEIQYAASPYDLEFQPTVLREWNEKGEQLADEKSIKEMQQTANNNFPTEIPKKEEKSVENHTLTKNDLPKEEIKEEPKKEIDKSRVNLEAVVKIKDRTTGKIESYKIVLDGDGDAKKRRISENSVMGKNLMGKKVGQVAKIKLESGIKEFEILDIKYLN